MLLFVVVSYLVFLLLPALASVHVPTPKDRINLAARDIKRLSTPLRNLLQKRDLVLFAGHPNAANILALNSTNGQVTETIPFQQEIHIPGQKPGVYFLVKGEIDENNSVTVEFWIHILYDRRIGVYQGGLGVGVDMKIPDSIKVASGEARLYMVSSGDYELMIFEAYGSVSAIGPSTTFPHFQTPIKRWKRGIPASIQDVPDSSGVRTVPNNAVSVK